MTFPIPFPFVHFRTLPNISLLTLLLQFTLFSFFLMTMSLSLHLTKLNSSIQLLPLTLPWNHSGSFPPSPYPSDSFIPVTKIFPKCVQYFLSFLALLDTWKAYKTDGIPSVFLKKCAFMLIPSLGKLFHCYLSSNTFPSCSKLALIKLVWMRGDLSTPSIFQLFLPPACLQFSNVFPIPKFKSILLLAIFFSNRQYGLRWGHSTGDFETLLSDSWSSYNLVALYLPKAFNKDW